MSGLAKWGVGAVGSILVHVVGIALFFITNFVDEAPQQTAMQSRLNLETVAVRQQDAEPSHAQGQSAEEKAAKGDKKSADAS